MFIDRIMFPFHSIFDNFVSVTCFFSTKPGWGNEDKQSTAPLNKPYYDTNTAFFPSFTLSMRICILRPIE